MRTKLAASVLIALGAAIAFAQSKPAITSATPVQEQGSWTVQLVLSDSLAADPGPSPSRNLTPNQCGFINLTEGGSPKAESCVKSPDGAAVKITLAEGETLRADTIYVAVLKNVTLAAKIAGGQPRTNQTLEARVVFPESIFRAASGNEAHGSSCLLGRLRLAGLGKSITPAKGRDDSNFYFSGQVTHSRGQDFVGSYDTKIDLTKKCNINRAVNTLGLTFELKGGNDPNGSPDSLNLGYLWAMPVFSSNKSFIRFVRLNVTPKLESTQDFRQRNFITTTDLQARLRQWVSPGSKVRAHVYPLFGTEVGKNLRGIIPQVDGRNITRAKAGLSALLIFDSRKEPGSTQFQNITLETDYARRWPLIDEVTFAKNKTGFKPVFVGSNPRDHIKQTLAINFTNFIGLNVAYEYGSLPPSYQFLDSKFTIGLSMKAAFK